MAVNVSKYVGGGFAYLYYGIIDSNGYLQGVGTSVPSAGDQDGSSMAQLVGAYNFPWAVSQAQRVNVEADDGVIANFMFYPTELPQPQVTMRASDLDFDALCESTLIHEIGGFSILGRQPYQPTWRDMCFMVVSQAKTVLDSGDSIAEGLSHWECLFVGPCNVQPQGRAAHQTATANVDYNYQLACSNASQYPWGLAFSAGSNGTTKMPAFVFTSTYKPHMQRWTGDNSEDTFNLGANIALDAATNIIVYVDGAAVTWVTGAPSAGEFGITEGATDTLVFGTAPGDGSEVVALFGWS